MATRNHKTDPAAAMAVIQDDIQALTRDLGHLVSALKANGGQRASAAASSLGEMATERVGELQDTVRNQPLQACAIAAAAGAVVGALIARR